MKKTILALSLFILVAFASDQLIKDGSYSGTSRSKYIEEPYYGNTQLIVEGGKIKSVAFTIYDSAKHEYFNASYEKYFAGNDLYVQQCRNDWKGIQAYPDSLMKHQDINKVDVISGATWSYNIFKASVEEALSDKKPGR
jgi:major membrane immunogen (membrane-anchored lipoprotein)